MVRSSIMALLECWHLNGLAHSVMDILNEKYKDLGPGLTVRLVGASVVMPSVLPSSKSTYQDRS